MSRKTRRTKNTEPKKRGLQAIESLEARQMMAVGFSAFGGGLLKALPVDTTPVANIIDAVTTPQTNTLRVPTVETELSLSRPPISSKSVSSRTIRMPS